MGEKNIEIEAINPVSLYGVNDSNLDVMRSFFPRLKVIARGNQLKLIGEDEQIGKFESKLQTIIEFFHKYNSLSTSDIENIFDVKEESRQSSNPSQQTHGDSGDVLVFGNGGLIVKPRTQNQRNMVASLKKNDMLFAIGPAGTGKTYTAVAIAVNALKNKLVRKIILTRPAVEAGENLGFLPGDLKEKLDPYLQPLYDALRDMIPAEKLASFIETGVIQIAPLAFMRGRTLDHAVVILDEAQNATESQLKMFLTRMGQNAKFIITGDVSQIDLPRNQRSGLVQAIKLLDKNVEGLDFIFLDEKDVMRHRLVRRIVEAYGEDSKKSQP